MIAFRIVLSAAMLVSWAARAAPIFLGAGTVGLEPPPGMVAKGDNTFIEGDSSIWVKGMAASAFARIDADRAKMAADLVGPGASVAPFSAGENHGFIVRGRKLTAGAEFRAWIVVLAAPRQTAFVAAYISAIDVRITDAAVEASLRTIAIRDTPGLDAQTKALHFVVGDLAGFHAVSASAEARTLELADSAGGSRDDGAATPHVVIRGEAASFRTSEALRTRYAEQLLWSAERIKPDNIDATKLFEANGGRYTELHASKTSDATHAAIDIVFFARFEDDSFALLISCKAPHPAAPAVVERFRALALSVRPKR